MKILFNSTKKFFGSSIFSMNLNKLKKCTSSNNLSKSLKVNCEKMNYNNLLIADQIYNLGRINLNNCLSNLILNENKLEILEENLKDKDILEVNFILIN